MVRKLIVPVLAMLASMLAACASPASPAAAPQTINATAPDSGPTASAPAGLARTDSQGSVEFVVSPVNLAAPGETLDFDISMNTHSVDLSWNLAAQSVLTTDTGLEVKGLSWPAGSGHHYEGTLTFPAKTADGKSLLDGAKRLTLRIRDAGVPERVFEWEVSQ